MATIIYRNVTANGAWIVDPAATSPYVIPNANGDTFAALVSRDAKTAAAGIVTSAPVNTTVPVVTGTVQVGQTLTASNGTWTGSPAPTYAYQWQTSVNGTSGWSNIGGATSAGYTVAGGDANQFLRCTVTATNASGSASASSAATIQVPAGLTAPVNTAVPTLTGTVQVGVQLTGANGAWTGNPAPTFAYQHQRATAGLPGVYADIAGATAINYTPVPGDANHTIRLRVRATNSEGSADAFSAPTALVTAAPVNTALPVVPASPVVGEVATATVGTWTGFPVPTLTYQWQRSANGTSGWSNISGATALAYTPVVGDVGQFLRIVETADNGVGAPVVANSSASGAVGGVTMPASATMRFGAKTLAGAGAWRPVDSANVPVDLVSYDSLVSGSLGAYTPSISGGGIRFTGGGAGAPAGAVLRCTHARGGTIDLTVGSLIANEFSCATLAEVDAAYKAGTCAFGDTWRLRAGDHNLAAARVIISRTTNPSGAWSGLAIDDPANNWLTLTRDPGAPVRVGAVELGTGGTGNPHYIRVNDLDFVAPLTADGNGLGPGSVSGIINLTTSTAAVTNCRMGHVSAVTNTTEGTFRAINSPTAGGPFWIEGNTITGARHGVIGGQVGSVIRGNTIKRILSDVFPMAHCNGALIENNLVTEKLYAYTPLPITGIAFGATTVVTMADTTIVNTVEPAAFDGIGGALGALLNGKVSDVLSKTATTVTLAIDTTGAPAWDGLTGEMHFASSLHGDYVQNNENLGLAVQNNVTIQNNWFFDGPTDGNHFMGGQGMFAGNTGSTDDRVGWSILNNIIVVGYVHGITISKLKDSRIWANTVIRILGKDQVGSVRPAISLGADCSGISLRDNIATALTINPSSTIEDLNNFTVPLVNPEAMPADPADIAAYAARFVAPVTVPDTAYDPRTAFATRTDVGSVYTGPIYPGATPYMNYTTNVYTNPRAGQVPGQFGTGDWTLVDTTVGGTLQVTPTTLPAGGETEPSSIEYRVNGGSWVDTGGLGQFSITGLTNNVSADVEIRLKNAGGATGTASAIKAATPTTASTVGLRSSGKSLVNTGTFSVTLPTYVSGDLLLVALIHSNTSAITTPAGWTLVDFQDGWSGAAAAITVIKRTSDGSEGSSLSVTQSVAANCTAIPMAWQLASGTGVTAKTKNFNGSPTAPTITVTAGSYGIAIWGAQSVDITPPADSGTTIQSQAGAGYRANVRIYGPLSAGATGALVASSASGAWAGMHVEVLD